MSVQFFFLSKHIIQLKHKATQLQVFVNSKIKKDKLKKILQWIYIEFFVRSVQNFIKRVLNRLGVQVAYRSRRSELGPGIELGQANFYSAGLGAG